MRYALQLASAFLGAALLIGCDKIDSTTSNPASKPPDVAENSAQTPKVTSTDNATGTVNDMKDMAHEKMDAAKDTLNTAGSSVVARPSAANSTASPAVTSTAPANAAVSGDTAQAQSLLDQAMQYIKDNKLDDADTALTKLEALKPKLPAEWASKIDSARSAFNTAKSGSDKLKSLVPGGAK